MTGGARARRAGGPLALAAAALAGGAAACVRVDPAPNGISSVRLDAAPPSIALGDSLRDSAGAAVPVRGIAYDRQGAVTATATFRFSYLPYKPDTAAGAPVDTALVVDPVTGAVRATPTWVDSVGRVLVEAGSGIQLADTVRIVPPPDSLVATAATDTLRFDCTDPRTTAVQRGASDPVGTFVNTVGPFTVGVRGDSARVRVGVRRWLVRWSLDSVPAAVPTVKLASGRTVPAIGVITNGADQYLGYDTTDATGASNVRLRIQPPALGKAYVADTLFAVTLRADVIAGAGRPVRASPARGVFRVLLSRRGVPPEGSTLGVTCQR